MKMIELSQNRFWTGDSSVLFQPFGKDRSSFFPFLAAAQGLVQKESSALDDDNWLRASSSHLSQKTREKYMKSVQLELSVRGE